MKLGLLSRAKIGAYCSMKFIKFENELYAVLNKKSLMKQNSMSDLSQSKLLNWHESFDIGHKIIQITSINSRMIPFINWSK
ncbi:hypothetical protein F946_02337 [Acinetobacter johnsonii ANC 3681]|uniref:Uncharacterized protein n=2 Tax=Acinetobacter johnsonii TaxID=40214 RepID=N9BGQ4_ACIJO|nr:hypothetical protein F986_02140 [Acinetobacter johnsonii CIP 64.6]ENV72857.1 hypothetical protein F946_02337 [Acinetobacter johnsonii ANC 3681]OYW70143.1 MAG: hypothetical protein B7Z24_04375 [Pseudomonadales bacterium 32-42-5]SUT95233.1 Uncharacterised protein [Acinetobacter johnsonii]